MPELEFTAWNEGTEIDDEDPGFWDIVTGQATWTACLLTDKDDIGMFPVCIAYM